MAGENKDLKALPTTVPVPVAPTDPSLEINLPSFKYFTQVVQPLVFDDSLSLYEVTQKLSALLNANIAQVNNLTGAVKDFVDYMVNWGTVLRQEWIDYQTELNKEWEDYQTELNKEWEDYQTELNKEWEDYQNTMNTWRQDLEARWAAYQTNLNAQWNQFKTDWQNTWNTWKTDTEADILSWEADFEETWNTWKSQIEQTIQEDVDTWLENHYENFPVDNIGEVIFSGSAHNGDTITLNSNISKYNYCLINCYYSQTCPILAYNSDSTKLIAGSGVTITATGEHFMFTITVNKNTSKLQIQSEFPSDIIVTRIFGIIYKNR